MAVSAGRSEQYGKFWNRMIPMIKGAGIASHGLPLVKDGGGWLKIPASDSRYHYAVGITSNGPKVEIGFFHNQEWSNRVFERLQFHRKDIERSFGHELTWRAMPDRQRSLVNRTSNYVFDDDEQRDELTGWLLVNLAQLMAAFEPYMEDAICHADAWIGHVKGK